MYYGQSGGREDLMAKSDNVPVRPFHLRIYGTGEQRLASLLAAFALALLLADAIASAANGAFAQAIHGQTDITGDGNLATVYSALLAGLAAFKSLRLATSTATGKPAAGWLLLATCLGGLAALELAGRTAWLPSPIVFIPLLGLSVVLFLRGQTGVKRRHNLLLLTMAAALLVVALTEHIKETIVGDPANYTFAGNDVPYRFNADAMDRLTAVTYLQEAAEIAALLILIAVLAALRVARSRG